MTDAIRRILRLLIFAASLSPAAFMVWEAATNLNANPFRGIVRSTAFGTITPGFGLDMVPRLVEDG